MTTLNMSAVENAMAGILSDLRRKFLLTLNEVEGTTAWVSGLGSQQDHAVKVEGERIERLSGELADKVRSGALSFEKWAGIAKACWEALDYYAAETGNWGWTEIIRQTLAASASDVTTAAKSAGDAAPYIAGVIIAILVLLIVLRLVL